METSVSDVADLFIQVCGSFDTEFYMTEFMGKKHPATHELLLDAPLRGAGAVFTEPRPACGAGSLIGESGNGVR